MGAKAVTMLAAKYQTRMDVLVDTRRDELTLEGANEIGIRDKNATRRCALTNSYWYWQLQKGEYQSSTAYLYCRWTSTSSLPTGQEGQTAAIYKRLGYYVSNNRTIKLLLPKDLESSE